MTSIPAKKFLARSHYKDINFVYEFPFYEFDNGLVWVPNNPPYANDAPGPHTDTFYEERSYLLTMQCVVEVTELSPVEIFKVYLAKMYRLSLANNGARSPKAEELIKRKPRSKPDLTQSSKLA